MQGMLNMLLFTSYVKGGEEIRRENDVTLKTVMEVPSIKNTMMINPKI